MATKKKAAKKKAAKKSKAKTATLVDLSQLKFNPRWFSDPPPDFFRQLDRSVIRQIAQIKTNFTKQINEVLRKR